MIDEYTLCAAAGQTDAIVSISANSRLLSAQGIVYSAPGQLEPEPKDDSLGSTDWVDLVLSQGRSLHPTGHDWSSRFPTLD